MLKYNGGNRVEKGTYWNFNTLARIDITGEGTLPGDAKLAYYRMPAAAIIVLAPVLGLLYAAFLPFIGIAMLTKLVGQKAAGGVMHLVHGGASFGWRPSESYLAGKKKEETKKDEASEGTEEKKES